MMRKIFAGAAIALSLGGCISTNKTYSIIETQGYVTGKIRLTAPEEFYYDQFHDNSNNYTVFFIARIDDELAGFAYAQKDLHKTVDSTHIINVQYMQETTSKYKGKKLLEEKITDVTVMNAKPTGFKNIEFELFLFNQRMQYQMNNIKDD